MADLLTFEMWPVGHGPPTPEGTYSRLAWLPTVGPSAWLVWGTVATQLRGPTNRAVWEFGGLAAAHGLSPRNAKNAPMQRTLDRLCGFRLMARDGDLFRVRMSAPPLTSGQLDRLPPFVAELHRQTFPAVEVPA